MKTRKTLIALLIVSLIFSIISSWQFFESLRPHIIRLSTNQTQLSFTIFVLIAVSLQIVGHIIRSKKHALLLRQIRPLPTYEVFKGQMVGFLFNALLPFRLGELIRAHYIGKGVRISRAAVLGTILFERMIDVAIIILILLIGFVSLQATTIYSLITPVIGMLITLLVLIVIIWAARTQNAYLLKLIYNTTRIFNTSLKNRFRLMAWSLIFGLKTMLNQKIIPAYIGLSFLMWLCYLGSTVMIYVLFFPNSTSYILGGVAPYITTSTPIGPTYLVSFDSVLRSIAELYSQHTQYSVLFAIISWLVLILPSIILGSVFVLRRQPVSKSPLLSPVEVMKNKLYRDTDISNEFGSFLDTYFKGTEINRILSDNEVADNYTVVKTFKGGSNALTLLAWQDNTMIVKKITLNQYADKLAAQYNWLYARRGFKEITHVLGENHGTDHYTIDLEYRDDFITFFDYIHSSDTRSSWKVLLGILQFMDKNIYEPTKIHDQRKRVDEYIESKIIGKIRDAANTSSVISQALDHKKIIVNGRRLQNFNEIIERIRNNDQAMADLAQFEESPIHGDLTVDNVIVNPSNGDFLLLDPNNENAISDNITDYGKLFQSVHSGYEFLVMMQFAELRKNKVMFEEKTSMQYNFLYKKLNAHLKRALPPSQYRSILFHEAVHYCRMLTYRVHINPATAIAFYAIAVRLFNDFMDQYDT